MAFIRNNSVLIEAGTVTWWTSKTTCTPCDMETTKYTSVHFHQHQCKNLRKTQNGTKCLVHLPSTTHPSEPQSELFRAVNLALQRTVQGLVFERLADPEAFIASEAERDSDSESVDPD
jgi:hypothetical protein